MRNIAVILAGGTGRRTGLPLPKQFLSLGGHTVIEHVVETFDTHPAIDEVALVTHPDWRDRMQEIVAKNSWSKVAKVVDGGTERYLSSLNAIQAFRDYPDDTNLLLHDAARPWVSVEVIDRVVASLQHHDAVGVAIPATDTVWEVASCSEGHEHTVARIPERRLMWLAQTPQAFRLPLIREAYRRALQDPDLTATDDCGVVRRYMPEVEIFVVEGEAANRKITVREDLGLTGDNNIQL